MAEQKSKSARAVAIEVMNRCDPKRNYAGKTLDSLRGQTDQSRRATDLVFGTFRNRTAIDTVIATFSGRPVRRIQAGLLNIIRVGTYELIYCPSVEQYAIVNEAVANAKATGSDKQAGFVNAVLRQITRHINNRQIPLTECDINRTLPQTLPTGRELHGVHGHKPIVVYGCQFDSSFLPDRRKVPAEYLSTVFSLPEWLIAGWIAEFGEEPTRRICLASNRRPSVYIRPNTLKTTIKALRQMLNAAEVEFEIAGDSEMILHRMPYCRIKSSHDVTRLPGFAEGHFTVQDITAARPVRNLEFRMKNEEFSILNSQFSILDLCAAPGTKTTQLAEATGDSAKIIATDINARRLEMVRENIARLGIQSVDVVPYEQIFNSKFEIRNSTFDCVLIDVPCSNTGVLARRVEVRYRIKPNKIRELSLLQAELLETASGLVAAGGKICYSTCSIQKQENNQIVEKFLEENKNFKLETEQLTLPSAEGFDHDGGYAAIITKRKN